MKVLAIDTSNYVLGVALLEEDKVIGEYITNLKKNHSVRAMPAIEHLLKDCDVPPKELSKIVVAKGPGSYTGVRIGVTIAKTLAWSLNIPLVGVSSLAVLASAGRYFNGLIAPLFDARRGNIYTGLYRYENGQLVTVIDDCHMLAEEWTKMIASYHQPVLFIGNDAPIHFKMFKQVLGDKAIMAEMTEHNPRPAELGKLGLSAKEESVHTFTPNYIRLAEAEAKWLEQEKNK
jgi:tRNA threonylcarbamoyladenosine biosynthesis protein TsaB